MRIFILALEGVDYYLSKKWGMRNLLQKIHGSIESHFDLQNPIERSTKTLISWRTFITGVLTSNKYLIKWKKNDSLFKIKLLKKILNNFNEIPTIFDKIEPSVAIDIPSYNVNIDYWKELNKEYKSGLGNYVNVAWSRHMLRKEKVMDNLFRDWRLFMVWFDLADLLTWIFIHKYPKYIRRIYSELDNLARTIKENISHDTALFIVSNHGIGSLYNINNTTSHALWSLNINLKWKPRSLADFYSMILELSKMEILET